MMDQNFVGIDSGSTMCKTVLFRGNQVLDTLMSKTGWNPRLSAKQDSDLLLERHRLSRENIVFATTGYGRETIDFSDHVFTEIICHAFGGMHLVPGIQGIIDIGGQDSKVIKIINQKVADFLMNDKCAAGTGRFLSMACDKLGIELESIDEFVNLDEYSQINSMCAVFAESEIIGLLSLETDRSKIMAGVLQSIAQRIRQMIEKLGFSKELPLLMTGGLSRSQALMEAISVATGFNVITHRYAPFAGAIGACVCAHGRERQSP